MPIKINVPQDGTLRDAISRISSGGLITVARGEYVLEKALYIDKPLRIEGAGLNETIVYGSDDYTLVHVWAEGMVEVSGITFDQRSTKPKGKVSKALTAEPFGCCLVLTSAELRIESCKFLGSEVKKPAHCDVSGVSLQQIIPKAYPCEEYPPRKPAVYISNCIFENLHTGIDERCDCYQPALSGNKFVSNHIDALSLLVYNSPIL